MSPLAEKAAKGGKKQPETGEKSRKTASFPLGKDQKDGIPEPHTIAQWSLSVNHQMQQQADKEYGA